MEEQRKITEADVARAVVLVTEEVIREKREEIIRRAHAKLKEIIEEEKRKV